MAPVSQSEYWKRRATNLHQVYRQLQSERVKKIMRILEISNSTYYAAFQKIHAEVLEGTTCCSMWRRERRR